MEDLEKALESITQRKSQITRTEEEVKTELYSLMEERRQTDENHNQAQSSLHEQRDTWQGKVVQIAELREQVSHAEKREALFRETLRQYKNSFLVQERIAALEKAVEENKDKKRELAHQFSQMRSDRERGQVMFNQARREEGIDPAAPENYETTKNECERLDDEFKRTSLLLEQDRERADQLRDNMETTINMRVLELQQRFKMYMSQFQFEGDISWESLEDQRKRIHFKLYIKARKEGHRGSLEDVSVKARGGKVGKGVSGGEESLSSLLFALALLQNLQTTPGFIVLDEFDSALDENRKSKVFDLYERELRRKLIILTPKSHEESYLNRFSKAFIVYHDPMIPKSKVVGIVKVTPLPQINKG